MSIFITGTDTGVGKTVLACRVLRELRAQGRRAVGFKPICCGDRADAEALHTASGGDIGIDEVNPCWLKIPLAPWPASQKEKIQIDTAALIQSYHRLARQFDVVVVEGVGGWLVPITRNYFVRDLAFQLHLPVIIVALNRLGCINHTLLALESVQANRLQCFGVVLNDNEATTEEARKSNRAVLQEIQGRPVFPMLAEEGRTISSEWRTLLDQLTVCRVSL